MAHVSDKVKVNMLLWYIPDGEDIYERFSLDEHHQYDLDLVWALFNHHCEPILTFKLPDRNLKLYHRHHQGHWIPSITEF